MFVSTGCQVASEGRAALMLKLKIEMNANGRMNPCLSHHKVNQYN